MKISDASSSAILSFIILIGTFPCGLSLHVVQGSNCTALCSDENLSSNTTSDDITCQDKGYEDTVVGRTFKDCVTCELGSKSFDPGTEQTDVGWALYNMRYASNWCLFGAAASTNEKSRIAVCDEACQPTEKSLDVNSENATTTTPYGYCEDLDTVAFTNCAVCYAQVTDHDYLSNFLRLLSSACEWKTIPPMNFPVTGSQVFNHHAPSNYSALGPNSSPHSSSGLTNQSKLAIGIAIPIILLLVLCSLLLFWYFKFHLPDKSLHRPFEEPEFQLYERRGGGGGGEKGTPLSPDSPWHGNHTPTIYHPTPALQHNTRYAPPPPLPLSPPPAHLRLHGTGTTPGLGQQQQQQPSRPRSKPNIKIETGAIMAAAPSVRSGSPPTGRLSRRKDSPTPLSSTPFAMEGNTTQPKEGEVEGEVEGSGSGSGSGDKPKNIFRARARAPFAALRGMAAKTKPKMKGKSKGTGGRGKDGTGQEDLFS